MRLPFVSVLALVLILGACGGDGDSSPVLQLKHGSVTEDELLEYLRARTNDGAPSEDLIRLCVLSRDGAGGVEVAERVAELLVGTSPGQPDFDAALQRVAAHAHRRCHPLENIPGDAAWRREMVPVYVARTFRAAVGCVSRPLISP